MKHLTRWMPTSRVRLGRLRLEGVLLAGVTLLTLALVISGLLIPPTSASAAPFRPHPTPTPTTQPSPTPTPRRTATPVPSPTARATPTAAATSTAIPGAPRGRTAGAGPGASQTPAALVQSLLLWGLGGVVAALLICGICIWLFARRTVHGHQPHPAFASSARVPTRERLTQLHQVLPARTGSPPKAPGEGQEAAETRQAAGDAAHPWSPPSELPWSSSPEPPQWLIEAGLLQNRAREDQSDAEREP